MESERRATLGPLTQSTLNSRPILNSGAGRPSTSADLSIMKPGRMSLGVHANRIVSTTSLLHGKRTSVGVSR
jgi:hypothetical protein